MLFGRSQLLLAGIPTGAALIGLLWLKRRRSAQSLHHTDPGGSPSPEEEDIIKEIHKEERRIEEEEISNCRVKVEDNSLKVELLDNITQAYIDKNCENSQQSSELLTDTCSETEKDSSEESELLEELKESKLSNNSTEDLFMIEIDSLNTEDKVEIQEEVNKEDLEGVEEKEEKVIEETVLEKRDNQISTTDTIKISSELEQPVEKIGDSVEVIVVEQQKEKEEKQLVLTSSTEERVTLVKEEEKEKINQESEEGATGNMKTGPAQLVEKLASLELDTMKIRDDTVETEQKGCTERDSANHSPSEVMLASPSISNFSDAHSEGSSDSGKGHSDVATSPSRTPAGGSSLAGDLAPSIYEFVLPQVIVGRLIGRRGVFLHEIRTSTQTNIYIKRHPDTDRLKICAIEGSQQDIDKALAKIRQKFPLRRFPQLTLEKVSFVTLNQLPPLKLEDFHLQLVEGVNNDVILSSLITAAHFFLQQPSHPSYSSLGTLNQVMNQVYSTSEAPALETPIKDAVCAAPTMGGWYRAQIVNLEEEAGTSTVRFLDYGGYLTLESSYLRQIRGDLLALPFQAVECYLANVAPADEEGWTEEARLFVHNTTVGQILQAQIYDYADDGTPLVYLYASFGSQVVLINEELVKRGFGVLTSSIQE